MKSLENHKDDLFTVNLFGFIFIIIGTTIFSFGGFAINVPSLMVLIVFWVVGAIFLFGGYKWSKRIKEDALEARFKELEKNVEPEK